MNSLCLVAGLLLAPLGETITLSWMHSIEKIVWEEDYRREGTALRLVEARVRGTGAGMEPPPGAILREGVWRYCPEISLLPRVALRHSPHATAHVVCSEGNCKHLNEWLPGLPAEAIVELQACRYH